MKAPVAFGLVSLGVLAFACAPRGRAGDSAGSASRGQPVKIETALAVNVGGDGDDVRFAFRVTNSGGTKAEMHFPSGQTHDVVVLDSLGREVWRWSRGRMFTQLMQNRVLRNADTIAFTERWRDPPRGEYVAVASLASENFPVEHRAAFRIP